MRVQLKRVITIVGTEQREHELEEESRQSQGCDAVELFWVMKNQGPVVKIDKGQFCNFAGMSTPPLEG